jgi:hypothetical protein
VSKRNRKGKAQKSRKASKEFRIDNISLKIRVSKPKSKKYDDKEVNHFLKFGNNFITVLQMLWKYIHSIGILSEITSKTSIGTLFLLIDEIQHIAQERKDPPLAEAEVEIAGEDKNGKRENEKKKIKIYDPSHLVKLLDFKKHNEAAKSILHETAIQQLVNAWEKLISDIIGWYYSRNPDKVSDKLTISYNKILQFKDLNEAKQYVLDQEIKNFLSLSIDEQVKNINSIFNINFNSLFRKSDFLKEIILTRHLIVHCGCIITQEFYNHWSKLKNKKLDELEIGSKLQLDPSFIISAWETLYEAGVILSHAIGRRLYGNFMEEIDSFMNNAAFLCIQQDQLTAAKTILEYASSLHISSTSMSWFLKLNLAQTYKWLGENEKCNEILNDIDYDAANVKFQIAISALREDYDAFKEKLNEVAQKRLINITELYEWPIFRTIRKHPDFNKWVEEAYGYTLNKFRALFEPKVIDFSPDFTLRRISDHFEQKNIKN